MKRSDPKFDPNYYGHNRRERFANQWHLATCSRVVREQEWWLESIAFRVCDGFMQFAYGKNDEEEKPHHYLPCDACPDEEWNPCPPNCVVCWKIHGDMGEHKRKFWNEDGTKKEEENNGTPS